MLSKIRQSVSSTYFSLVMVGLMWILPFLAYRHAYPLTTFYQEWWSALLGVLAITLLSTRDFWRHPEVPRIALFPAMLVGLVLLQWGLDKIVYLDQALLYILYLLFATLLMLLGARLRDCLGIEKLALALAAFLLVGAELSALIGVLQHYHWHTPLDSVVAMKVSASVYGNIAQPNHFAHYITLGLISLGLLFQQQKLKMSKMVLLAIPLLFVMTLSGSRSSWLYLLMMLVLAWWLTQRDASQRPLLRYCLLLVVGFGVMHLIVQLPFVAEVGSSTNTMQRLFGGNTSEGLFADKASGGVRLFLWREASLMFMQSPWLGVGFGQFAWQHFQMLPELRPSGIAGLYNNAHNLVFQLAAEAGILGLLALLLPLGVWVHGQRRATLGAAHWWGYAALAVLVIHSMLEYPLWYTYFVAIAAILLGALDETRYHLGLRKAGRMSVVAVLLLGLVALMQLLSSYRDLEQLHELRAASNTEAGVIELRRNKLLAVHGGSLLSPYAELYMSSLLEVNDDHLKEKLSLNSRVMRFVPIGAVAYRQAMLLAQANQLEQAKIIISQAIWSFPEGFPRAHKQMTELAEKDPVHFSALLEFALPKAQEYHRAIRQ